MNHQIGLHFKPRRLKPILRQIALLFVVVISLIYAPSQATPAHAYPPVGSDWQLIFNDDFDGNALNTGLWNTCDLVDRGNSTCKGGASGELALYTPDSVSVQNGALRFTAQLRSYTDGQGTVHNYTSGMVSTRDKFSFQYGYMETRVRIPKGRALWPTMFTLPVKRRSLPPEIDVVEQLGHDTTLAFLTYHFEGVPLSDPNRQVQQIVTNPNDWASDWHTFGVDWQPGLMVWYVDGIEQFRVADRVPAEPMNLLLTLGIGVNWRGNNFPDANTIFPAYDDIDYVQVWQRGPPQTTVVDDLNNFSKLFAYSRNMTFFANNLNNFGADISRLGRSTNTAEFATWKMGNMSTFTATTYYWPSETLPDFKFKASPDNANFTEVTPVINRPGGNWRRVDYSLTPPAGTNYMRVEWPTGGANNWNPQIASVGYSGNPPPPPTPPPTPVPPPAPTPPPLPSTLYGPPIDQNWHLVFNDEFSGNTLNSGKWASCDLRDRGNNTCKGGSTGELALYTPDGIVVENGMLRLKAEKRSYTDGQGVVHGYTSGIASTRDKFSFRYGYMEARVNVPKGRALWPGLFTLPVYRRSIPPEIDVFELLGNDPTLAFLTYHFEGIPFTDPNRQTQLIAVNNNDFSKDWYTFGVDWQPGLIVWYINGVEQFRTTDRVPDEAMNLLLTLGVGVDWRGNNFPDGNTPFPSYFNVDYVKVWQRGPQSNTLSDDLGTLGNAYAYSRNITRTFDTPELFGGDVSRAVRMSNTVESITWAMGNATIFNTTAYYSSTDASGDFKFYTSPDNINFTEIAPEIARLGGNWARVDYVVRPPVGTTFVKVVWLANTTDLLSPQLGSVSISGNPAPQPTPVFPPSPPGTPPPPPSPFTRNTPPLPGNWHLVFGDEFSGSNLDNGLWATCDLVDRGNNTCKGGSTGELALYKPDGVIVEQGMLRLKAQRRSATDGQGVGYNYTSGLVSTRDKFNFQYGYMEARLRTPKGTALWPTFFTLPVKRRSIPPEIDVVESLGNDPTLAFLTYHFEGIPFSDPNRQIQRILTNTAGYNTDWHTFGVDWQPGLLIWYVDDVEQFRTTDRVVNEPINMLLTLGVGVNWRGNNFPDTHTAFPAYHDIDYVKVWQRGPQPSLVLDTLDNLQLAYAYSRNTTFFTNTINNFGNDVSRLGRSTNTAEWVTWKMPGMELFKTTTYFWPSETLGDFQFFASPDNINFSAVTPTAIRTASNWRKVDYEVRPPAGTNYLKMVFPVGGANNWNPQISSVAFSSNPSQITPTPTTIPVSTPTPSPTPPATQNFTDDLNDFSKVFARSFSINLLTDKPTNFAGDASRMSRNKNTAEWAVWRLDGMRNFAATTYFYPALTQGDFVLYTSPDNVTYTPIIPAINNLGGNWHRVDYVLSNLPAGTNYVKLEFPTAGAQNWTVQVGSVSYGK